MLFRCFISQIITVHSYLKSLDFFFSLWPILENKVYVDVSTIAEDTRQRIVEECETRSDVKYCEIFFEN